MDFELRSKTQPQLRLDVDSTQENGTRGLRVVEKIIGNLTKRPTNEMNEFHLMTWDNRWIELGVAGLRDHPDTQRDVIQGDERTDLSAPLYIDLGTWIRTVDTEGSVRYQNKGY